MTELTSTPARPAVSQAMIRSAIWLISQKIAPDSPQELADIIEDAYDHEFRTGGEQLAETIAPFIPVNLDADDQLLLGSIHERIEQALTIETVQWFNKNKDRLHRYAKGELIAQGRIDDIVEVNGNSIGMYRIERLSESYRPRATFYYLPMEQAEPIKEM